MARAPRCACCSVPAAARLQPSACLRAPAARSVRGCCALTPLLLAITAGADAQRATSRAGQPVSAQLQDWRAIKVPFQEHSKPQRSSKVPPRCPALPAQAHRAVAAPPAPQQAARHGWLRAGGRALPQVLATTLSYSLQCDAELVALAAKGSPPDARQALVVAALQHVEKAYSRRLDRANTLIRVGGRRRHWLHAQLPCLCPCLPLLCGGRCEASTAHQGHMPCALQIAASEASEGEVQRSQQAAQQRAVLEAAAGTGAQALPQPLLSKLASLSTTAQEQPAGPNSRSSSSAGGRGVAPGSSTGSAQAGPGGKQAQKARPLIQELAPEPGDLIKAVHTSSGSSSSSSSSSSSGGGSGGSGGGPEGAGCAAAAAPCSHSVSEVEAGGRACVRVAVGLPGLRSAAEVALEVEGRCLLLSWAEGEARIPLPGEVDDEGAVARFDKRRQVLTVTLPRAQE